MVDATKSSVQKAYDMNWEIIRRRRNLGFARTTSLGDTM
jgi:hypothetical protein